MCKELIEWREFWNIWTTNNTQCRAPNHRKWLNYWKDLCVCTRDWVHEANEAKNQKSDFIAREFIILSVGCLKVSNFIEKLSHTDCCCHTSVSVINQFQWEQSHDNREAAPWQMLVWPLVAPGSVVTPQSQWCNSPHTAWCTTILGRMALIVHITHYIVHIQMSCRVLLYLSLLARPLLSPRV